MCPVVPSVQLYRVTNRGLLPTSRLHQLNLHRHRQRRIEDGAISGFPDLLDRNFRHGRDLCVRNGEATRSIPRHFRRKPLNRHFFNRVSDIEKCTVNLFRSRQVGERVRPVVPSVQLYRVTDGSCLPVNGLHQLNLHRHRGVRIKRITLSVLPHLVHRDFGRRRRLRRGLRVRDRETTRRIARHLRGETVNRKFLNRVRDRSLLTVHKLPFRQIRERMRPVVLGVQLDRVTNGGGLPVDGLHQLNLHRHRQRRIKILAIERLPDLVHRDLCRRRWGLRIRDRETTLHITRDSRGEALNSQLLNGVADLGLLAVNGFGGRQICERVCPCVLSV